MRIGLLGYSARAMGVIIVRFLFHVAPRTERLIFTCHVSTDIRHVSRWFKVVNPYRYIWILTNLEQLFLREKCKDQKRLHRWRAHEPQVHGDRQWSYSTSVPRLLYATAR